MGQQEACRSVSNRWSRLLLAGVELGHAGADFMEELIWILFAAGQK